MKKVIYFTALAGLLTGLLALPAAAQQFRVMISGQEVALANQPYALGAEIMVPLRDSLQAIGATDIKYLPDQRQVTFFHNGRQVTLDLNRQVAMVNGMTLPMTGPVRNVEGRLYVRSSAVALLDPSFTVVRTAVAGFRGTPAIPQPAGNIFRLNGQTFAYNAPTWYQGDTLMVPLAETLSTFNVDNLSWQPGDLQATFSYGGQDILLNVNSGYAYIGTQARVLDAPVTVRNDTIYVPASFLNTLNPGYSISGMTMQRSVRGIRQTPRTVGSGK